jgi:WhiB family redox-sensing transcriptional regulator
MDSQLDPLDHSWRNDALCLEIENKNIFFPGRGTQAAQLEPVRKICNSCLVKTECLEYGLTLPHNEVGIYGGLTGRERRREQARRKNLLKQSVA